MECRCAHGLDAVRQHGGARRPGPDARTRAPAPGGPLCSAAERRGNVLGVYEAENTDRIRGAKVLLIDDILTTGATLGECVRVLREAGAADVVCATLARAVTEKEKDGARRGTPV